MPQYQPRPMVVIRNQLLAFLVLHLLGSCVPIQIVQPSNAVSAQCCQPKPFVSKGLPGQIKLVAPSMHSR